MLAHSVAGAPLDSVNRIAALSKTRLPGTSVVRSAETRYASRPVM
jgi:hypothetical protein